MKKKKTKRVNGGHGSRKHRKALLSHYKEQANKSNATPFSMAVDAAAAVVGSTVLRGGVKDGAVALQLDHFTLAVRDRLLKNYNEDGSFRDD